MTESAKKLHYAPGISISGINMTWCCLPSTDSCFSSKCLVLTGMSCHTASGISYHSTHLIFSQMPIEHINLKQDNLIPALILHWNHDLWSIHKAMDSRSYRWSTHALPQLGVLVCCFQLHVSLTASIFINFPDWPVSFASSDLTAPSITRKKFCTLCGKLYPQFSTAFTIKASTPTSEPGRKLTFPTQTAYRYFIILLA